MKKNTYMTPKLMLIKMLTEDILNGSAEETTPANEAFNGLDDGML